jgi:hypothetical protein
MNDEISLERSEERALVHAEMALHFLRRIGGSDAARLMDPRRQLKVVLENVRSAPLIDLEASTHEADPDPIIVLASTVEYLLSTVEDEAIRTALHIGRERRKSTGGSLEQLHGADLDTIVDDLEALRHRLRRTEAQVRFLDRRLKDESC